MKVIASHNGQKAVERTWERLASGVAAIDAVVDGITLIEDDPDELTVGYGGLPNEDGEVELDAAVMCGTQHRGAGVAGLKHIRHPAQVARLLLEQTGRCLLVGDGAYKFARANGFPHEDLLTEKARQMWLYWKRSRSEYDDWKTPAEGGGPLDLEQWFAKQFYRRRNADGMAELSFGPTGAAKLAGEGGDPLRPVRTDPPSGPKKLGGGTVHVAALDRAGNLACSTSTSGHAFKLAGRVGDSPILGAGLWADSDVGTCGSIGHGEANLENQTSSLVVELMRQGRTIENAGLEAMRRVADHARPDQRDAAGRPNFNLQLFIMAKNGQTAGVAMWGPKQYLVADETGVRYQECVPLHTL